VDTGEGLDMGLLCCDEWEIGAQVVMMGGKFSC
jgi:hypothetical protein